MGTRSFNKFKKLIPGRRGKKGAAHGGAPTEEGVRQGGMLGEMATPEPVPTLLQTALQALEKGWSVFPVNLKEGPHPCLRLTGHIKEDGSSYSWSALQRKRPTRNDVETWFAEEKGKGIAVVTGKISGLFVLDFDGPAGQELHTQLELPVHVRTRSGGIHVYLQHPGWLVRNSVKVEQWTEKGFGGLDVRGDGGYAVMPPTRTPQGSYTWEFQPGLPEPLLPSVLPHELVEQLGLLKRPRSPSAARKPTSAPKKPAGPQNVQPGMNATDRVDPGVLVDRYMKKATVGQRNTVGFDLAVQLRDNGYSLEEARPHLLAYQAQVTSNEEPYTVSEAESSLQQAYSRRKRDPWGLPSRKEEEEEKDAGADTPVPTLVLAGEQEAPHLEAAFLAAGLNFRACFSPEESVLRQQAQEGRTVYAVAPTDDTVERLHAAGVKWTPIAPSEQTGIPDKDAALFLETFNKSRRGAGDWRVLHEIIPSIADQRFKQGTRTYSTGLDGFDAALGGGFYSGLHVLGGVTGGGKTALSLFIAEHNASQGRPVLYVTYEQSAYELWSRLISAGTGIPLSELRAGRTAADGKPVRERLESSPEYQRLTHDVAPWLKVSEGNGPHDGLYNIRKLAEEVQKMTSVYRKPPLVILDYLQRMPSHGTVDRRHQIDQVVSDLQVEVGRGLEAPVLLISSVARGKYGNLLKAGLEERLAVFKESGGVEYTAYTASLLYPMTREMELQFGTSLPGTRVVVLDLVKNREGEAPQQFALRWSPAAGAFTLLSRLSSSPDTHGKRA